ncbi:MAG: SMC family ATPase [Blastocatellia bacterium]|nr:SMC family ATPase [Blastocatellia bacterium]
MHITKIELENIKSHAESVFEFSPGTTAISGENGAGKTTLIEAVAWTLFDVLDYKKDDFVRRGAKKGSARVSFLSGLDDREYLVYRDTGTGYFVYDPAIKIRIAEKKEEVTRFLWQHLRLEPGTDLESLFKHAVGVPQGTFTAIFLATPSDRKRTFDALLKVEEYRRGAEELLQTQRFVENQLRDVREKIARSGGLIEELPQIQDQADQLKKELSTLSDQYERTSGELEAKRSLVAELDKKEADLNALSRAVETKQAELARAELILQQREAEFKEAGEAAAKIAAVREDASIHVKALDRLKELERERHERDKLRNELALVDSALTKVNAEAKSLAEKLKSLQTARIQIEELKPLAEVQGDLEARITAVRNNAADAKAAAERIPAAEDRLQRLRASYAENKRLIDESTELSLAAAELVNLQTKETQLVADIAKARAELERDEKFRSEMHNGLCPILSERCLNLKDGQTLEGFLSGQFEELKSQIATLESARAGLGGELKRSRDAERNITRLETLQLRATEIEQEGTRLKEEKAELERKAQPLGELETELRSVEAELAKLDNPKGRLAILDRDVASEHEIREQVSNVESNLERLNSDHQILAEQLESYKDLDEQWKENTEQRDATTEAHRTMVRYESIAELANSRRTALAEQQELAVIASGELTAAQKAYGDSAESYDREAHLTEKRLASELENTAVEQRTLLTTVKSRVDEVDERIDRLLIVKKEMESELREKERLEKLVETTVFIRDTLKEAAPLVARNYVYHVSLEANQMYREITGNAECSLKWTEDYSIVLEEGGHSRPFVSFSGGEQMVAALAVRLALLKQLSDIRIAFFDEPTTNMDAERRENLAMQISQIKHFDQMFVISHDDTFEGYMDHEIRLERQ